jgi:phosphopantetheine--protein transferase-like protein
MLEKIRPVIAVFLRTTEEHITPATIIDRTAVGSSIHVHRMYAKLAAEGIVAKDYQDIITVNDLLQRINGDDKQLTAAAGPVPYETAPSVVTNSPGSGIGIDIEEIAAMPLTNDFREDAFYTMNFTPAEIAWCILQYNPYASFAGLFAAKEAMVKADNSYKDRTFNNISIQHLPGGQPFHMAFQLSISHTDKLAIAIAQPLQEERGVKPAMTPGQEQTNTASTPSWLWILAVLSFILSVLALFEALKK